MDKELIQSILNTSARVLHAVEIADLEQYIEAVSLNNSTYDALGPMLDPTDYRKNLQSGRLDNLRVELQIARKLLEVRKLLDEIEVVK
jgi:hypothetical protein